MTADTHFSISVGTNYRFDAREVMDLLREHAGVDERTAADIVTKFVRPRELAAARRDLSDARETVKYYEAQVRELEAVIDG